jgi:retron-type reverse transcriptase
MARVARRIEDRRVLRLIRRFLEAGMMAGGVETARTQGTPQGGPLSPLLSNILLTDLDRELEARELSRSAAMRTTATFMWAVSGQANASWQG